MLNILIYDSGVGNRPIADAIDHQLPASILHLLSDTGFFPYGEKSDIELMQRVMSVLDLAFEEVTPDLVVLACNTLSTIALDKVRQRYQVPVVGVVPAIKPAAEQSLSHVIGLIATPATINRQYTTSLIEQFASNIQVIKLGTTKLVHLAEQFAVSGMIDLNELHSVLLPFIKAQQEKNLDQLVLGCTHFPLLKNQIQQILPNVTIQDSSAAIGRQVKRLVGDTTILEGIDSTRVFYSTTESGQLLADK